MSDFERQMYNQRALDEQWKAATAETSRRNRQMYREFVDFLVARGIKPRPYFDVTSKSREREGLGKYLGGRTSYVVTREYSVIGHCWLFAYSEFSNHYAMTTDARAIRVTIHDPEPSKNLKLKFDAEAEKVYQAGASLLVGGVDDSESIFISQYLVRAAQSLVDGNGPISANDGK